MVSAALVAAAIGFLGFFPWRSPNRNPGSATPSLARPTIPRSTPWPTPSATAPEPPPADQPKNTVDDAIARGVSYLKRHLRTNELITTPFDVGHRFGTAPAKPDNPREEDTRYGDRALIALTLLECGVPSDDILIQETVTRVRSKVHPHSTWSLAWSIQLLDFLDDQEDKPLIRDRAMRLVVGQTAKGNWSQACPPLSSQEADALLAYLELAKRGQPLSPEEKRQQQSREALWDKLRQYNETFHASLHHAGYDRTVRDGNVANIRLAILGLNAARRHGVPVEPVLSQADAFLRRNQHADGSWWAREAVGPTSKHRAEMTCVGLLGLAARQGQFPPRPLSKAIVGKINDPAVARGIHFLDQSMSALQIPPPKRFPHPYANNLIGADAEDDLQFLWSLKQAATLYGIDTLARRDWYAWMQPLVLNAQQADGSWQDRYSGPVDTCYALLFVAHRPTRYAPLRSGISPGSQQHTPRIPRAEHDAPRKPFKPSRPHRDGP
jgi:hypothetical protein